MASQKVVIISGASSGIGLSAAIVFAQNGWKTYAGVRTLSKKQDIVDAAKNAKVQHLVEPIELDVTKADSVKRTVDHVLKASGHIDVLVNNAGFGIFGAVENFSDADISKQYDTNVVGVIRLIQAVLPHFRARKAGRIVNISSIVGSVSFPYFSLYTSTKWALEAISQSLHDEVAPFGIDVVVVQPGFTKTPFVLEQGHREVIDPVYDAGKQKAQQALAAGLASGAESVVVGQTIYTASTEQKPKFRYQCTPNDAALVASILKDSTSLNKGLAGASQ